MTIMMFIQQNQHLQDVVIWCWMWQRQYLARICLCTST